MQPLQLIIDSPCTQNWDTMLPQTNGKHCNQCNKTVVDFTYMTDNEVLHYFTNNTNQNICGRLAESQLNRDVALQLPMANNPSKWYLKYVALSLLFVNNYKANAQLGKIRLPENVCNKDTIMPKISIKNLQGKIVNTNVKSVVKTNIILGGVRSINKDIKPLLIVDGKITALADINKINPNIIEAVSILSNAAATALYGPDGVSGALLVTTKKITPLKKINNKVKDTINLQKHFNEPIIKVFPNPVSIGSIVSVVSNNITNNNCSLSIYNSSRQLIETFNVNTNNKFTFAISSKYSTGLYYIQLANSNNVILHSQKFIVL